MSKHASGPWVGYGNAILGPEPQDVDFNRLRGFDDDNGGLGYLIAESIPHAPTRRLIAAAPDLLEALKNLLAYLEDGIGDHDSGEGAAARAAIAKAEGKDHAPR